MHAQFLNTKDAIEKLVEFLSTEKILVSRTKASNILNVDHNRFNQLFVDTNMITPIIIGKQKRYDLRDVLALPELLKRAQRKLGSGEGRNGDLRVREKNRINFLMEKVYEEIGSSRHPELVEGCHRKQSKRHTSTGSV